MRRLTFEDFGQAVAGYLRLDPSPPIERGAGLYDSWSLDSVQAWELVVVIEGMASVLVPPGSLPMLLTLGDAYDYYISLLEGTN